MGDVVRMGKAIRFAIDDQLDVALRPARDVLAAMRTGPAKAELLEQRGEVACLGIADGEFDEADAAAARLGLKPRGRRTARAFTPAADGRTPAFTCARSLLPAIRLQAPRS